MLNRNLGEPQAIEVLCHQWSVRSSNACLIAVGSYRSPCHRSSAFLTHIKAPSKFGMFQISYVNVVCAKNIWKAKKLTESKRFAMRDG